MPASDLIQQQRQLVRELRQVRQQYKQSITAASNRLNAETEKAQLP